MRISDWSSDVCSSDLSQANEAGMPDHAFGSEFSKGDFGDKLGLHPMHPAAHFTRHIQGGGVLGKGRHLFPQILQHIRTEAGADAASIAPSVSAILRQQDRKSTRLNSSH